MATVDEIKKVVTIDFSSEALNGWKRAGEEIGNVKEKIQAAKQALKKDNNDEEARQALAVYTLQLKELTKAQKDYEKEARAKVRTLMQQIESVTKLEERLKAVKTLLENMVNIKPDDAKFVKLTKEAEQLTAKLKQARAMIDGMSSTTSVGTQTPKQQIGYYDQLTQEIKVYEQALRSLKQEQINTPENDRLREELALLQEKRRQVELAIDPVKRAREEERQRAKAAKENIVAEEGSVNQLRKEYNELYKTIMATSKAKLESDAGQQMIARAKELHEEILSVESSIGNFRSNVGNYVSGISPLTFQVNQLMRELPSLTMSANQFFLAISNNLPMFVDELTRARKANDELKASGKSTIPVFKQVLSAIFSWQTALVVGITLLSSYGKEIIGWISNLIKGAKAVDTAKMAQESFNATMARAEIEAAKEMVKVDLLKSVIEDETKAREDRLGAVKELRDKYPAYLKDMTDEQILANGLGKAYKELAEHIFEVAQARAVEQELEKNAAKIAKLTAVGKFDEEFYNNIKGQASGADQVIIDQKTGRPIMGGNYISAEKDRELKRIDYRNEVLSNLEKDSELYKEIVEKYNGDVTKFKEEIEAENQRYLDIYKTIYTPEEDKPSSGTSKASGTSIKDRLSAERNRLEKYIDDLLRLQDKAVGAKADITKILLQRGDMSLEKQLDTELEMLQQSTDQEIAEMRADTQETDRLLAQAAERRVKYQQAAKDKKTKLTKEEIAEGIRLVDEETARLTQLKQEQEDMITTILKRAEEGRFDIRRKYIKKGFELEMEAAERELNIKLLQKQQELAQAEGKDPNDPRIIAKAQLAVAEVEYDKANERLSRLKDMTSAEQETMFGSIDTVNLWKESIESASLDVINAYNNVQNAQDEYASSGIEAFIVGANSVADSLGIMTSGLQSLEQAMGENFEFVKALSLATVIANQAAALSYAVKTATAASATPFDMFALIATCISAVTSVFAQIISMAKGASIGGSSSSSGGGSGAAYSGGFNTVSAPSGAAGAVTAPNSALGFTGGFTPYAGIDTRGIDFAAFSGNIGQEVRDALLGVEINPTVRVLDINRGQSNVKVVENLSNMKVRGNKK